MVGVAIVAVALAGCESDSRGTGDSPVLGRQGDDTPAQVYNFPDGFGNLATKCVGHGYRAYVTTNGGGPSNIAVIPDPACAVDAPTTPVVPTGPPVPPSSGPAVTPSAGNGQ